MKQKANLLEQIDMKASQMEAIKNEITSLKESQNTHFQKLLAEHKAQQQELTSQQQGITNVHEKTSLIDQMRKDLESYRQNIAKLQANQDDLQR